MVRYVRSPGVPVDRGRDGDRRSQDYDDYSWDTDHPRPGPDQDRGLDNDLGTVPLPVGAPGTSFVL